MRPSAGEDQRAGVARLLVHLALIASVSASLVVEPVIALHVAFGFLFVGFVVVHLAQRRRTTGRLLQRLSSRLRLASPSSRLAVSDAALAVVTAAMLVSGLWDWLEGPTRIRWHAISGVILTGYLAVHTVRRRRRLARSAVR